MYAINGLKRVMHSNAPSTSRVFDSHEGDNSDIIEHPDFFPLAHGRLPLKKAFSFYHLF